MYDNKFPPISKQLNNFRKNKWNLYNSLQLTNNKDGENPPTNYDLEGFTNEQRT